MKSWEFLDKLCWISSSLCCVWLEFCKVWSSFRLLSASDLTTKCSSFSILDKSWSWEVTVCWFLSSAARRRCANLANASECCRSAVLKSRRDWVSVWDRPPLLFLSGEFPESFEPCEYMVECENLEREKCVRVVGWVRVCLVFYGVILVFFGVFRCL